MKWFGFFLTLAAGFAIAALVKQHGGSIEITLITFVAVILFIDPMVRYRWP